MTTINVNQFCQLCLSEQFYLHSINSVLPSTGNFICDVLNDVFDLEIRKDDDLPSKICSYCVLKTIRFDVFKKQAHQSKQEMKNLLEPLWKVGVNKCNSDLHVLNLVLVQFQTEKHNICDEVGVVESEAMLGNDADGIPKEINSEPIVEQDAIDTNSILDENHIKEELEEAESVHEHLSSRLSISDIPTKEDLHLEEWSNSESFGPKRTEESAESNVSFIRYDILSVVKNDSEESSLLGSIRDFHEENQVNVNDDTQEAGPSEIGECGSERTNGVPDGGYSCDICKKSFSHKWKVRYHMATHSKERPYVCVTCNKGFKWSHQIRRHQRMHKRHELVAKTEDNRKTFICTTCGKSYCSKQSLYSHSNTHLSKFVCNVCQKQFQSRSNLECHVLTHSKERPFLCGVCGKSFNSKNYLQNHVKTHSDGRNFKCLVCHKSFKTKER